VKDLEGTVLCDLSGRATGGLPAKVARAARAMRAFCPTSAGLQPLPNKGEGPGALAQHGAQAGRRRRTRGTAQCRQVHLISSVSAAKPKVADYPFTTLVPHLGWSRWEAGRPCDRRRGPVRDGRHPRPGRRAAEGRGLGHQFLRHIERARVLLILLDLAATDGVSPAEQQRILEGELGRYMPELLDRPRVVVGSKSDIAEVDGGTDATDGDEGVDYVISAVTGPGSARCSATSPPW